SLCVSFLPVALISPLFALLALCLFLLPPPLPRSPLFPYTTLFRSSAVCRTPAVQAGSGCNARAYRHIQSTLHRQRPAHGICRYRSEEHTSELQSRFDLVCRLLLEKKKNTNERRRSNKSQQIKQKLG